jgi:hypothetical protein
LTAKTTNLNSASQTSFAKKNFGDLSKTKLATGSNLQTVSANSALAPWKNSKLTNVAGTTTTTTGKPKFPGIDKLKNKPILTKDPGKGTTTPPSGAGTGTGNGTGTGGGKGPGTGNGDGTGGGKGKGNGMGGQGAFGSILSNLLQNLGQGGGGGDDGGGGGGGGGSDDSSTAAATPAAPVAETPAVAEAQPAAEAPLQVMTQDTSDSAGSVDLVLEDVKMSEDATLVAGPAYSVRFRNQGLQAAGRFVVAAVASPDGKLSDDAPRVMLDVPGLAAGEMREVVLRLPRCDFSHLIVLVDATNSVNEMDKTNNAAAIERSAL